MLIVDFYETASPWYRAWSALRPDHQRLNPWDSVVTFVWLAIVGASAVLAWRRAGTDSEPTLEDQPNSTTVS